MHPRELPKLWSTVRDDLDKLSDDELGVLSDIIRAMQSDISKVQDARTRALALATRRGTYWDRLPPPLRSKIFELCAPASSDDDWEANCNSDYPVILSLVSKDWQADALATPRIWSNIAFLERDQPTYKLARATLWFSRCTTTTTTVRIYLLMQSPSREANTTRLQAAMNLIATYISRCVRLTIRADRTGRFGVMLPYLQRPAPLLRQCSIDVVNWKRAEEDYATPMIQKMAVNLFNKDTPVLTTAHFMSNSVRWPLPTLVHLTTLRISFGGIASVREIVAPLGLSPTLTTVTLSGFKIAPLDPLANPKSTFIVVNESIRDLTIECSRSDQATLLIDMLDFPNLRSLSVTSSHPKSPDPELSRIRKSRPPFPSIHTFNLFCSFNNVALVDHLGRMDTLRTMHLVSVQAVEVLCDRHRVNSRGDFRLVCPRLDTLTVHAQGVYHPGAFGNTLANLVRVRAHEGNGVVRLKKLTSRSFETLDEDIISVLRKDYGFHLEARDTRVAVQHFPMIGF